MAINKKLIHFKTKSAFTAELNAGNILDTSIVFIKDTKEIWTHGQLYSCSLTEEEVNSLVEGSISTLKNALNNKADKTALNDYLPLAGGSMDPGSMITLSQGRVIIEDSEGDNAVSLTSDGFKSSYDSGRRSVEYANYITNHAFTDTYTYMFPRKTGTFALEEDIPDITDKVDKVEGKGLSTNDYTTDEKNKLAGIPADANHIDVDSALSDSSENPVQNKAVKAALDGYLPLTGGEVTGHLYLSADKSLIINAYNTNEQTIINKGSIVFNRVEDGKGYCIFGNNGIAYYNKNNTYAPQQLLSFPKFGGEIATTANIPDVSGKADTLVVNAELKEMSETTQLAIDEINGKLSWAEID